MEGLGQQVMLNRPLLYTLSFCFNFIALKKIITISMFIRNSKVHFKITTICIYIFNLSMVYTMAYMYTVKPCASRNILVPRKIL
jgi:hypothetical protein